MCVCVWVRGCVGVCVREGEERDIYIVWVGVCEREGEERDIYCVGGCV